MNAPPTAIIDACVLYSAPIRDLIVRLAQAGLLKARWTDEIHEEWMRNLLKNNPNVSPERLARTRTLMNEAVRDCLVTGYSDLVESLTLPDSDDRHVLAAAIRGGAGLVVTFNLSDFPSEALAPHGVDALHPDELFSELLDSAEDVFCEAARLQRQGLRNPSRNSWRLCTRRGFPGRSLGCELAPPASELTSGRESVELKPIRNLDFRPNHPPQRFKSEDRDGPHFPGPSRRTRPPDHPGRDVSKRTRW